MYVYVWLSYIAKSQLKAASLIRDCIKIETSVQIKSVRPTLDSSLGGGKSLKSSDWGRLLDSDTTRWDARGDLECNSRDPEHVRAGNGTSLLTGPTVSGGGSVDLPDPSREGACDLYEV